MTACEMCNDEIPEETPPSLVAAGGWCAPSEQMYEAWVMPTLCGDCHARWAMIMQLGIDPGKNGENLRIPRGSIKFREQA